MAFITLPNGRNYFTDDNGVPLVGGLLHTYEPGTGVTTPKDTYADANGDATNTNPIVLDSRGEATIFWDGGYNVRLENALGGLIWTVENINIAPSASDVIAQLAAPDGSSLVGYLQNGVGAIPRTVEDRLQEKISVFDFMTDAQRADVTSGAGLVDATASIEAAATALVSGQTLVFPGGTYLVSYIWAPYTDSSPDLPGRGRAVCYIFSKRNITLSGYGATIKCVGHDIATDGGFMVGLFDRAPNCRVEGFELDMTFSGYNTAGAYYPICGGFWANTKFAFHGTQDTICSGFTAIDLRFKLFHPLAAFASTANPYGKDSNNGYKIISVFASGDSAATLYAEQCRDVLFENIRFLEGHNGYGTWVVAYNDTRIRGLSADAWSLCKYDIPTATRVGGFAIGVARVYSYYCQGVDIDGINMRSLPWALRVDAFFGNANAVFVGSGLLDQTDGSTRIRGINSILDAATTAVAATFDAGIYVSASGSTVIDGCTTNAHRDAGAVSIFLLGSIADAGEGDGRMIVDITNFTTTKKICGPTVFIENGSNTSDAKRILKSVSFEGTIEGWGDVGAIYSRVSAGTYYGVEKLQVYSTTFNGIGSQCSTGAAVDARFRTSADLLMITDSPINGAGSPIQHGSASVCIHDNPMHDNALNSSTFSYVNTTADQFPVAFTAGQDVSIAGLTDGDVCWYVYEEITSAGAQVKTLRDNQYVAATGVIATVGGSSNGYLNYRKYATIK